MENSVNVPCFDRESSGRDEEATTLVDSGEMTKKQEERETKRKKEKRLKNKESFADSSVESQEAQVSLLTKKQSLLERKRGPHQKLLITPGGLWYDLVSMVRGLAISRDIVDLILFKNIFVSYF